LATVFGDGALALDEFANALGRVKAGQFGEAERELRRAGISNVDLKAKGINISNGGEIKATPDQMLNAIEQIVNERFGKMAGIMQAGPAAKWASMMDSIAKATRQAGDQIVKAFLPVLEKVSEAIGNLVQSGNIEKVSSSIAKMFDSGKFGDELVWALSYMVAAFDNIPKIIKGVTRLGWKA
jgi:hypothetical protein